MSPSTPEENPEESRRSRSDHTVSAARGAVSQQLADSERSGAPPTGVRVILCGRLNFRTLIEKLVDRMRWRIVDYRSTADVVVQGAMAKMTLVRQNPDIVFLTEEEMLRYCMGCVRVQFSSGGQCDTSANGLDNVCRILGLRRGSPPDFQVDVKQNRGEVMSVAYLKKVAQIPLPRLQLPKTQRRHTVPETAPSTSKQNPRRRKHSSANETTCTKRRRRPKGIDALWTSRAVSLSDTKAFRALLTLEDSARLLKRAQGAARIIKEGLHDATGTDTSLRVVTAVFMVRGNCLTTVQFTTMS